MVPVLGRIGLRTSVLYGFWRGPGGGGGSFDCCGVECGWSGEDDGGCLDLVEVGELFFEVGVALGDDLVLVGGFAVAGVDFVDDAHAIDDGAEGGEAHFVELGIVVVVDEELGGAGVGSGGGEDEGAAGVGVGDGVVLDGGVVPDLVDGGAGVESELDDEAGEDAEEGGVGEVSVADEVVEAVGAEGRPVAMDFDDEVAGGGGELHFVEGRGLGFEGGRLEQGGARGGGVRGGRPGRFGGGLGGGGLSVEEDRCAESEEGGNCFHDGDCTEWGEVWGGRWRAR